MELQKVIIENLFQIFNHEIKINQKSGITIIIGENGLGKTVLLEMIEAFFNKRYNYFSEVKFDKLIFEFSNNIKWVISKYDNLLNVVQSNNGINSTPVKIRIKSKKSINSHEAIFIAREIPYLEHIRPNRWRDMRNGELLDSSEILYRYKYNFESGVNEKKQPKWFKDKIEEINVNLIKTQRLLVINKDIATNSAIHTVQKYSDELSYEIKQKLAESTELSSKLDRTYPNRLINNIKNKMKSSISSDTLRKLMGELENKRTLLDKVGLIETEKDLDILQIDFEGDIVKDVLMQYVTDSFEKLKIFDEISLKISLLIDIINNRFKHKKLYVDKDYGFNFKSTIIKDSDTSYQTIPLDKLSSGEQNELVLFYELIFKTKSDSLILIDEPEISLHITWQNNFILDLKRIIELNNLDVLIATHSPDIIGNNWDLRVELKGVE